MYPATTICHTRLAISVGQRRLPKPLFRRQLSVSAADIAALNEWIHSEKIVTLSDTLRTEHLSDLYVTLPTRNGDAGLPEAPKEGAPLGYGHHLVFFHTRNPERALRQDGTDMDFCPPEPWTRRMWAGGRIVWKRPLLIGEKAVAAVRIGSVEKKGFEKGSPMVFVRQIIEYRKEGENEIAIEEERSHVYLASPGNKREVKVVKDLPAPDFAFSYRPSPTTLFRFSALTFNGHYIHLDKEYAQMSEGYPDRLVHGPLTALMLLEACRVMLPKSVLRSFEYRAVNPLVVNRFVRIYGSRVEADAKTIRMWAVDVETKVVGMVGKISLY